MVGPNRSSRLRLASYGLGGSRANGLPNGNDDCPGGDGHIPWYMKSTDESSGESDRAGTAPSGG